MLNPRSGSVVLACVWKEGKVEIGIGEEDEVVWKRKWSGSGSGSAIIFMVLELEMESVRVSHIHKHLPSSKRNLPSFPFNSNNSNPIGIEFRG